MRLQPEPEVAELEKQLPERFIAFQSAEVQDLAPLFRRAHEVAPGLAFTVIEVPVSAAESTFVYEPSLPEKAAFAQLSAENSTQAAFLEMVRNF